jgi:hypothetical protein
MNKHTVSALVLVLLMGLLSSTTITLNDTNLGNIGDSFVKSSAGTTNYGTSVLLETSTQSVFEYIYTLWNLSVIPSDAVITNATLCLYHGVGTGGTWRVTNTSNSWTETGITWNNQPVSTSDVQQDSKAAGTPPVLMCWYVTNATKYVWALSNKNLSLMVNQTVDADNTISFNSKENTTNRPQLLVTYLNGSEPATGLLGYWKFNENEGTFTHDYSGYNNTGTLYNTPTWGSSYNYQTPYALSFDGSTEYVSGSFNNAIDPMNFTVSAWIYPTSTDAGSVFELYNATSEWTFYSYGTFRLHNGNNDVYAGSAVPQNTWSHIAITYDGTYISGYLNGVLINSSTIAPSALHTPISPTFYIGTHYAWSARFKGIIDEVKIYNESKNATWSMSEFTRYCPLHPINIDTWNESSTSQYLNSFTMVASNSTSAFTYTTGPIYNVSFTDYYCNSSFPIGSVTISISNSSFYSPRYYYSTLAYGGSYTLAAYLLPSSDEFPILVNFKVISPAGSTIPNALITIQKQIGGVWVTVAQKYTDATGTAGFNLDYQTQYQIVTSASGYSVVYWVITPTYSTYQIYPSSLNQPDILGIVSQISVTCTVDNSSFPASIDINCSADDQSGQLSSVALNVSKGGTYGSIPVCSVVDDTANFSLGCTVDSPGNETISYTLTGLISVNATPAYYILSQNSFTMGYQAPYSNGLFPAFLISLTLGLLGLYINPSLGVVLYSSGWIFADLLRWIYMPPEAIGALAIITGLLVYLLRT